MTVLLNGSEPQGTLVFSLDFELYWGVRDRSLEEYGENISGVRTLLPRLLEYVAKNGIHITWATVGFLFFDSKEELIASLPANKPAGGGPDLNPYEYLQNIGASESADPCHYGLSLIQQIAETPHQEIGTHTFAHFHGWDRESHADYLANDLMAAKMSAERIGEKLESLVFPQNRYSDACLSECRKAGIKSYRGNPGLSCDWGPLKGLDIDNPLIKAKRFIDSFLPVSGDNTFDLESVAQSSPFNIPGSRFLRPYSSRLRFLEPYKILRMKSEMTLAAKNRKIYHLWFHPHNFGINQEKNMDIFKSIIEHFLDLKQKFGMQSMNMAEVAELAEAYAKQKNCTSGG